MKDGTTRCDDLSCGLTLLVIPGIRPGLLRALAEIVTAGDIEQEISSKLSFPESRNAGIQFELTITKDIP